jgi:hypothetical protein
MNVGRIVLYSLVVGLLVGGVVTVADAMVITDEEKLEAFLDEVTRSRGGDRVGRALHFADPNREPVAVAFDGGVRRFEDGQEVELEGALRSALGVFGAPELEPVQEDVELRGEDARVAVRVRTDAGLTDAQFELRRHDDGWLIRRVAVR